MKNKAGFFWLWKMAWRDSRKNWGRLLLFTSSIILGIAALVAINSFGVNLKEDIEDEAKTLVGADLVITCLQDPKEDSVMTNLLDSIQSIGQDRAREVSFSSMIYFPKKEGTRLVQVRALEGNFPFYGEIETEPTNAAKEFQKGRKAVVDKTLLLQFNAKVGDSIRIGKVNFLVIGELLKAPGQTGISASVAPAVYVPLEYIEQTGLLQRGSRVNYRNYFSLNTQAIDIKVLEENIKPRIVERNFRYETVERRKRNLGNVFDFLTSFLNLVAFIALLLGCVGVASAVHIYIKEKIAAVAVLRCLGVKGWQAFLIYLLQIASMGFLGSLIGAILGSAVQVLLPQVLGDFLPVEVSFSFSISVILQGILTGVSIAVLFALLPLLRIRNISPLRTLRASLEDDNSTTDPFSWVVYSLIILFVTGFAFLQIGGVWDSLIFTGAIGLQFLILAGMARLMMWITRKFFPTSWSYVWRQSLANLYRPNNQTLILMVAIGLGTALLVTLYIIQNTLLNQVAFADRNEQPNMVLFDIQTAQKAEVTKFTESYDLPVLQEVPIVTMRLDEYKGESRTALLKDTTSELPRDVVTREYRVTYRDTLGKNEELVGGTLQKEVKSKNDSIFISMSETHAGRMNAKIGDEIIFNVQGKKIKTYIGSLRKINFNRIETSFTVVFPKGVLENAPQFHVLITRVPNEKTSAKFQQALVKNYPNISIVDLNLILDTAEEILGQISFVIRFMALFSIFTGLIVLSGSVTLSRLQRIQESVLLRTLGANRRQIFFITFLEYVFLGGLAAFTGILLAFAGGWALAVYSFNVSFNVDILPVLAVFFIIVALTVLIGLSGSRSVLTRPPLEILRNAV